MAQWVLSRPRSLTRTKEGNQRHGRRHHHEGEHEVEEDLPAREVEDAEGVSGQGGQQQHADHCRAADDDAVDDELLHNLPGKAVVLPVERKGECKGLADELRDGLEGDEEGHEKGRDRADEKEKPG